jgi:hypothetical protein
MIVSYFFGVFGFLTISFRSYGLSPLGVFQIFGGGFYLNTTVCNYFSYFPEFRILRVSDRRSASKIYFRGFIVEAM